MLFRMVVVHCSMLKWLSHLENIVHSESSSQIACETTNQVTPGLAGALPPLVLQSPAHLL